MTTIQDVLSAAQQLTPVEQLEVIQALSRSLKERYTSPGLDGALTPRLLGLHTGKVWMSDDFDAELTLDLTPGPSPFRRGESGAVRCDES